MYTSTALCINKFLRVLLCSGVITAHGSFLSHYFNWTRLGLHFCTPDLSCVASVGFLTVTNDVYNLLGHPDYHSTSRKSRSSPSSLITCFLGRLRFDIHECCVIDENVLW